MSTFTAENRAVLLRELRELQDTENLPDILGRALPTIVQHLLACHDHAVLRAYEAEQTRVVAELQAQERVDFIRSTATALFANLHHTMRIQPDEQRRCWELAQRLWEAKPDGC